MVPLPQAPEQVSLYTYDAISAFLAQATLLSRDEVPEGAI
jgi:hypothetical protein